jgi:hypothetical protein
MTAGEYQAYPTGKRAPEQQKSYDDNPFPSGSACRWWYHGWLEQVPRSASAPHDFALHLTWFGAGRKAENPPDARYPLGISVDCTTGRSSCAVSLLCPAPGVGKWIIRVTYAPGRGP